mmetsp:Transcript_72745/g.128182  ORF Transcript_72745/g.128182 Transcript_72745/m.128182 type:complete len:508 (-) Transcript_72745:1691-3214(-)
MRVSWKPPIQPLVSILAQRKEARLFDFQSLPVLQQQIILLCPCLLFDGLDLCPPLLPLFPLFLKDLFALDLLRLLPFLSFPLPLVPFLFLLLSVICSVICTPLQLTDCVALSGHQFAFGKVVLLPQRRDVARIGGDEVADAFCVQCQFYQLFQQQKSLILPIIVVCIEAPQLLCFGTDLLQFDFIGVLLFDCLLLGLLLLFGILLLGLVLDAVRTIPVGAGQLLQGRVQTEQVVPIVTQLTDNHLLELVCLLADLTLALLLLVLGFRFGVNHLLPRPRQALLAGQAYGLPQHGGDVIHPVPTPAPLGSLLPVRQHAAHQRPIHLLDDLVLVKGGHGIHPQGKREPRDLQGLGKEVYKVVHKHHVLEYVCINLTNKLVAWTDDSFWVLQFSVENLGWWASLLCLFPQPLFLLFLLPLHLLLLLLLLSLPSLLFPLLLLDALGLLLKPGLLFKSLLLDPCSLLLQGLLGSPLGLLGCLLRCQNGSGPHSFLLGLQLLLGDFWGLGLPCL